MTIGLITAIVVFVLLWAWCIWDFINAPMMPDDYGSENYNNTKEELRDE